ncbi:unnamed protein product [Nippostrongylus brasiliensis]|uniref:NAD_binding_4 domain-containing protein n=1 Tax=Nippostrongylus brasiliensis TaxID=27835 RepID=A0A0N4YNP3_NIPBR|nr:unnamed protein product [Nippostrongylus brasiliensis]
MFPGNGDFEEVDWKSQLNTATRVIAQQIGVQDTGDFLNAPRNVVTTTLTSGFPLGLGRSLLNIAKDEHTGAVCYVGGRSRAQLVEHLHICASRKEAYSLTTENLQNADIRLRISFW